MGHVIVSNEYYEYGLTHNLNTSEKALVYVLERNEKHVGNLSKVGSTKISADLRAKDYTDGEWKVFFTLEVPLILQFIVESSAHKILQDKDLWFDPAFVSGSAREVFCCDSKVAKDAVVQSWSEVKRKFAMEIGLPKWIFDLPREYKSMNDFVKAYEDREIALKKEVDLINASRNRTEKKLHEVEEKHKTKLESVYSNINARNLSITATKANIKKFEKMSACKLRSNKEKNDVMLNYKRMLGLLKDLILTLEKDF